MSELQRHRLVEAIQRAKVLQIGFVRGTGFTREDVDQIPRRKFQDKEVDAPDQEQDYQNLTKPPDHVLRDDHTSLQLAMIYSIIAIPPPGRSKAKASEGMSPPCSISAR